MERRAADHCLDLRRVEQGVVDEALVDGAENAGFVLRVKGRGEDFDVETRQAGRLCGLFGGDLNLETGALERMGIEILGDVETGAGAEGGEQEFGRGHALIIAAII